MAKKKRTPSRKTSRPRARAKAGRGYPRLGVFLIALGVFPLLLSLALVSGYDKNKGLVWNIQHMKVKVGKQGPLEFVGIGEFRKKYPEFNELTDRQLTEVIHSKYFDTVISLEGFREKFAPKVKPFKSAEATKVLKHDAYTDERLKEARELGISKTRNAKTVPFKYIFITALALVFSGICALLTPRRR